MVNFPIFNTKELSDGKIYDINSPAGRRAYFESKLGSKIEALKDYLDNNSFVGFWLAKKGAGKGTYSKLIEEIVGPERVAHLSVGDLVRHVHSTVEDPSELQKLKDYLHQNYRGFISVDEAIDALLNRTQSKLVPTEFILALVKREIEKIGRKALFIDGFPRNLDQISYSLYFRELINFRDDPDFFILIDIPESVIDARIKSRVVCPICKLSRNEKLLPTSLIDFDPVDQHYYLLCDNQNCSGYGTQRLSKKEGDELGIEVIRDRLETDGRLIELATSLQGVSKIFLRNSIPVVDAETFVENYELTPEYSYKVNAGTTKVEVQQNPWIIKDDQGVDSYSLLAPAVAVSLVSQLYDLLIKH